MNYTQRKARELAYICGLTDEIESLSETEEKMVALIENRIKEIIRDTRHKCAENVISSNDNNALDQEQDYKTRLKCHNIVMNTNLDI